MNENSEPLHVDAGEVLSKSFPLTEQEKSEWVRRFHESGLSLRKFCVQHGLPRMSLWRWANPGKVAKRVAAVAAPLQFQEIKLSVPPVAGSLWAAELSLPNGTVLRLSREVPMAIFQQLLRLC